MLVHLTTSIHVIIQMPQKVTYGVFSQGGEAVCFLPLFISNDIYVGFQVLEYKRYLLNGSCNYRGQVYLVLTIAWICYYFQISISIFEHILRCFFLFLSPFLFSLLNYFCNLLVIDNVRLYAFLFWLMLHFQT